MKTYLHGPMDCAKKLKLRIRVGDLGLLVPERRKRCTRRRKDEDVATTVCPCGTTMESRARIVSLGECEMCKKERDALEKETRKLDHVCGMEEFGRLERVARTRSLS